VEYRLTNGEAVIYNMTVGSYRTRALYLNVPVLDGEVEIRGEDSEIPVNIYRLNVRAYTVYGQPLNSGILSIDVGGQAVEAEVSSLSKHN